MASTFTGSLGLEKQGDGENANTWGLRLNQSVIDLVDEAVAGYVAVALTSGVETTITVSDGASSTGRNASLEFTGDVAANVTVTLPAQTKTYSVINSVTNGGNVLIRNTGAAASTIVTVKASETALLATNGSLIKRIGPKEEFESGTRMAFAQAVAPTGWTVETCATYDNAALRIITASTSGTGGGTAGTNTFNAAFNTAITVTVAGDTVNATLTGSTSAKTLSTAHLPSHRHFMFTNVTVANAAGNVISTSQVSFMRGQTGDSSQDHKYRMAQSATSATLGRTSNIGSNSGHSHSLAGKGSHNHEVSITGSFNLDPKYVNFIVCTKD